ncbi:MAG: hypothetical protein R3Y24_06790 [Eubacteriales bacterium]
MNIILVFDYERHDTNFSEEKINLLQNYFQDVTDVGLLYINYPMIESYQHIFSLPDYDYENRKISVSLQPGYQYKNLVKSSMIATLMELPKKIDGILFERFKIVDKELRSKCVKRILQIDFVDPDTKKTLKKILLDVLNEEQILTVGYQIDVLIKNSGYAYNGKNYYEHMREIFKDIIIHNICKANKVMNGNYNISLKDLKQNFLELDYAEILLAQNLCSNDEVSGIIWVLNTSMLFIPEYNFCLIYE